ncbi:cadherin-like beta sandwich domain-containing protein [Eshraghiella crossota]|uniref:cadherin-like beta sandwich domain-containing protein n=1 Tax=Eshraghiella crossota TaxID=45851 RepID=UPI003FD7A176
MKKLCKKMTTLLLMMSFVMISIFKMDKLNVNAASNNLSIGINKNQVVSGDTIDVDINFDLEYDIFYATFYVNYDINYLEFVSSSGNYQPQTNEPSGVIPYQIDASRNSKSVNLKLTFKAKNVGDTSISVNDNIFSLYKPGEEDPVRVDIPSQSASVKVMAVGSDDATLSSIQVGGANLSPAFAKWTLDYKCYVDNSVTSVNIAAASSQGGRVEIAGNTDNLAVGNNYVTITSYAPNGKAMKYNLNIFRLEPPTDPPTEAPTDPPTEPPASFKVTMDGKEYNVSSEFDAGKVPDGFEVELGSYNGKDVITATGSATGFTLMYLVDSEGNGNFYVYDGKNFYPYIVISNSENTYYVFDSRKADTSMAGEEKDVKIKDTAIKGYVDGEYIYFYAMNSNKKYSWYSYDTVEGTIQRLRTTSPEIIEDETTPEDTASTPVTGKNDDGVSFNNKNIIIIGGALLLIVIAGAVIFLISKKTKKYDGYNEEFAATYEHPDEETIEEDIIPVTEDKPEEESAPESEEK